MRHDAVDGDVAVSNHRLVPMFVALGFASIAACSSSAPPPPPEVTSPASGPDPQPEPHSDPGGVQTSGSGDDAKREIARSTVDEAPTPDELALLMRPMADPPAKVLLGTTPDLVGKHYLAGNEKRLDVFAPTLDGLGGLYVGVGSDQAYLFIGWQRPALAFLIDYDPDVVAIHGAYQAFFAVAENPDDFVALWSGDGKDDGVAALDAQLEGDRRERVRALYLEHRGWIHRRVSGLQKRQRKHKVKSFLTDQASYDFVRAYVLNGRTRPILANLLEKGALEQIGAAAEELGEPVRVLYLSNAEEYWKGYPAQFRTNVRALPYDERSRVLRTLLTWGENQDYQYNHQLAQNFVQWLAHEWVDHVHLVAPRKRYKTPADRPPVELNETTTLPDQSPHRPQ